MAASKARDAQFAGMSPEWRARIESEVYMGSYAPTQHRSGAAVLNEHELVQTARELMAFPQGVSDY